MKLLTTPLVLALAALALAAPAAMSAEPPAVATGKATEVGRATATLNGSVDPEGAALEECKFEYLTQTAYQASGGTFAGAEEAPCAESIGTGTEPVTVHADLSGLADSTLYRFRLLATNEGGPRQGATAAFSTGAFGLAPGSFTAGSFQGDGSGVFGTGASPDTRAGGHPFQASTVFQLDTHPVIGATVNNPSNPHPIIPAPSGGPARDVVAKLPPGFLGDPFATPRCPQPFLVQHGYCPNDTAIGVIHVRFALNLGGSVARETRSYYFPVYNMVPSFGEPALFGFYNLQPSQAIFLHLRLDPSRDYAVTASVSKISALGEFWRSELTIWGVPADPAHDPYRGFRTEGGGAPEFGPGCIVVSEDHGGPTMGLSCPSEALPHALLTDPTSCPSAPLLTGLSVDAWADPGRRDSEGEPDLSDTAWQSATAPAPAPTGCDRLRFGGPEAPVSLEMRPASQTAATPSAYTATLKLPYNENTTGLISYGDEAPVLANPTLRDTTVTLPEGVVVNPSSANGLEACSTAQIGLATPAGTAPIRFDGKPARCPDASKLGTLEVHSPLIDHPLEGAVFLAAQDDNPFHSLLAIYLAIEDPQTGTIVKLAGKVTPDPDTGQLSATFDENPQLPFTELKLSFFGGAHASLTNPATCGAYTTTSTLTPWSAPQTPAVISKSTFEVTSGPNGGACARTAAERPNDPSFEAGTISPFAGTYSPFVLHLRREDGSQQLKSLDLTLPPGLTGRLAGVPYCSDGALALAATRDGRYEQAHPDCPSASQVGTVDVAAGAGPDPFHAQGTAYLAGPYKGAPLSMAIVTPAVAGPFDLGTVVVRTALYVDPETAQISAKSDPIPTILEGIPLDVRSIAIKLDRPGGFTINPTSCEAMSLTGQAISTTGNVASLHNRFQVGGCKGLDFKPKLALRVFGKTNRNAKPRLRAILRARQGEANIARAQVNLPHSEFLEQSHIKTICTRVRWNAGGGHGSECPKGSIYGRAKAWTPLLAQPLQGPVYLRSSSHKLPDLVAALNGQVDVELAGKVDSGPNEGIRNTFEVVPDAPVSRFVLEMRGGRKGLLVNSENLCSKKAKTRAIVRLTAQNGAVRYWQPRVRNDCVKRRHKRQEAHARARGSLHERHDRKGRHG